MAKGLTLSCPCGSAHTRPGFAYDAPPEGEMKFDLKGVPYRRSYAICEICGHWSGQHELDLSALYGRDYVDVTYGGAAGMERRFNKIMALLPEHSDNRQRVARVNAFAAEHSPSGRRRLLDVGAGLGVFPAAMRDLGWDAVGLEPDPRTVEHLRIVAGVTALVDRIQDLDPAKTGLFSLISFNKVLEHIEEPIAFLAAALPLLETGGFIYIEVPDVAAAAEGPSREEFFIEHHHVFSPASLVMMAEKAGLSLKRLERLREASSKFTLAMFAGRAR